MADIIYTYYNSVYFNITNKCPCRCVFCIRDKVDAIGEAENLFHETEPTLNEIKKAVDDYDFSGKDTAVFCGYGEPTNAFGNLIATAEYLREKYPSLKLRLNTNGLSDLINEKETAKEICRVFDSVSVSLNDVSSEAYDKITRNIYPGKAYEAMLKFAKECVNEGVETRLSVVDVIGEEKIKKAKEIADSIGADFLCRKYDN
ncbi:MAG: TatD family nuclease-associated radical SAM protein [Acutalibacteraceae bacterium]|nr:TatD family nuclease-associated radical SAM protein [Acutalibacteraceae bacterium]